MVSQGIEETEPIFSSVITVCGNEDFFREGIQIHCRVILLGFGLNLFIGSSLVNLYLHTGLVDAALKLFDQMPERNLAVWNSMLNGFLELGKIEELFGLHGQMKWEGEPNGLSFCYLIRACCNGRFLDEVKQLHCHAIKVVWVECYQGNDALCSTLFRPCQTKQIPPLVSPGEQTKIMDWNFGIGAAIGFLLTVYFCFKSGWVFGSAKHIFFLQKEE